MRTLKETGTSEAELKSAIHELLRRKQELLEREREPNTNVSTLEMQNVREHAAIFHFLSRLCSSSSSS